MRKNILTLLIFPLLYVLACSKVNSDIAPIIDVLSSTINGFTATNNNLEVQRDAEIIFVFSSAIDPVSFQSAFAIKGGDETLAYTFSYANAASKVSIMTTLAYDTDYEVIVEVKPIGANGEKLATALSFSFKTAADGIIRSTDPCTNVGDCLRSVSLEGSQGQGKFEFYSNYLIYEEEAEWENLTHAVIVIHGASHNPDDYFNWMTNTFESENISANTILIAPNFKSTAASSPEDFYWPNTNWRRGRPSANSNQLSSFDAIDSLINQLANKNRFPVLKKIIITGHSSGAAFTHVYAGANKSEALHSSIEFEYVVANSQFFYYPNDKRIDESNNQLYTPSGCSASTIWPLGYNATPSYLTQTSLTTFNSQFTSRNITYLLGNGNQADPTFNSSNCENTLQGSSRYNRGENMFRFMELTYPGGHNHKKAIVNGIGHDGQGMYQSNEFKALLSTLLQ